MYTEKDPLSIGDLYFDSLTTFMNAVGSGIPIRIPFVVNSSGKIEEINECFIFLTGEQKENIMPIKIFFRQSGTRNSPLCTLPWRGYINPTTLVGHPDDVNNLPELFRD